MPSVVQVLLHPERRRPDPAPFEVDVLRVIGAGTAAWALALVVTAVLWLTGTVTWQAPATCATGVVLGGAWALHERRRRAARRRTGQGG